MTKNEFLQQVKFDQPTVFILRGLPGSGKSSLAREACGKSYKRNAICSADSFFIKNEEYIFDRPRIGEAHCWCLRNFIQNAHPGNDINSIFLDNTNTSLWEFSHYVKIAEAYYYKTVIITLNCSPETSLARNIHNVPEKTIQNMYKRLNDVDNCLKLNAFCREHKIEQFVIDGE
jgi:hypothetical protein